MAETAKMIRDFFSNLFRSRRFDELKETYAERILLLERATETLREVHARELTRLNRLITKQEHDSTEALAKAEKERDYFRGKCDRFELLLLTPRPTPTTVTRRPGPTPVVGRKTWAQIQLEDLQRQEEEAKKIQREAAAVESMKREAPAAADAGTEAKQSA